MNHGFDLRPYQDRAFNETIEGFKETRRQLGVMATGGGKTVIAAALAKHYQPERSLILAHTNELCSQAWDKLHRSTGLLAGIEKAEARADHQDAVVVSSVQTMTRRLDRWKPDHFGLVIGDEAHLSMSDSYSKILNHFTGARILGITATPMRSDNKKLSTLFDKIAFQVTLRELVKDGYLSPIRIQTLPVNIDLSGVRKSQGDFDESEVDLRLQPHLVELAHLVKEHAGDRKCLWFWPLIRTSEAGRQACQDVGLEARHIDGNSENRKTLLDEFHRGDFHSLHNSNLLTTGYDEPSISCIVLTRPTQSKGLMFQMCGRGTRIHPGKENLLILDPLWLSEKFDLASPASLIAENEDQATRMAKKIREATDESVGLFEVEEDVEHEREAALKRELARNQRRTAQNFDPLSFASLTHQMAIADYEPTCAWESAPPTERQVALLAKWRFDTSTIKSKGMASKILDTCFKRMDSGLATPAQMFWLRKLGHPSPETASKEAAGQYLDAKWGKKAV